MYLAVNGCFVHQSKLSFSDAVGGLPYSLVYPYEHYPATGADRIELCSALQLGGLTPTAGLLHEVKQRCAVPIYCMIRCRAGDFVYSSSEMGTMLSDVRHLKAMGANGFVFGALSLSGTIDEDQCKKIVDECYPIPVTLHRAFDYCSDWKQALDIAKRVGFSSVLTSGQHKTALEGCDRLCQISEYNNGRLTIMAGSGVTVETLPVLLQKVMNIHAVHGSASVPKKKEFCSTPPFSLGTLDSNEQRETSADLVAKIVQITKSY